MKTTISKLAKAGTVAGALSQQDAPTPANDAGQDILPPQSDNSSEKSVTCTTQDKVSCLVPVHMSCPVSDVLSDPVQMVPFGLSDAPSFEWVDHVNASSATALQAEFPSAHNSHRAMKQRAKKGCVIHPAFEDFKSFLRHMGPPPTKSATVDRIDPTDPTYGPGLVRWADKATQASNKTNTIIINDPHTGEAWTITRLAKHRGMSADTLRKQRARGASDYELIHGRPAPASAAHVVPLDRAPKSKLAYLSSPPRTLYSDRLDINLIERSSLWMAIATKFILTWDDVNHIEKQLFEWFPEIKGRYFDVDFVPPPRKKYPDGRWKQLFDMFPIELEHLSAINDYFVAERVPGGKEKVKARRDAERRTLERREAERYRLWEEWETIRSQAQLSDLSEQAWAHLRSMGYHPVDAWDLFLSMQDDEDVRGLDFEDFVLQLNDDAPAHSENDDQIRRNLALEVGPMPPVSTEWPEDIEDVDMDPADCAAPREIDDEDD